MVTSRKPSARMVAELALMESLKRPDNLPGWPAARLDWTYMGGLLRRELVEMIHWDGQQLYRATAAGRALIAVSKDENSGKADAKTSLT